MTTIDELKPHAETPGNIRTHSNPPREDNTLLIASDPREMVTAQVGLMANVAAKIEATKIEAKDAHDMVGVMRAAKLDWKKADKLHKRATARVTYLSKMHAALAAGYVMMPDMPGELIAVRTDSVFVRGAAQWWGEYRGMGTHREKAKSLPAGQGEYKGSRHKVESRRVEGNDGKYMHTETRSMSVLQDPDGIDRKFIKPGVISRLAGAMHHKIFDEIVCVGAEPEHRVVTKVPARDPIVLGRIVDPVNKRAAVFLIAWFIDPATDI